MEKHEAESIFKRAISNAVNNSDDISSAYEAAKEFILSTEYSSVLDSWVDEYANEYARQINFGFTPSKEYRVKAREQVMNEFQRDLYVRIVRAWSENRGYDMLSFMSGFFGSVSTAGVEIKPRLDVNIEAWEAGKAANPENRLRLSRLSRAVKKTATGHGNKEDKKCNSI